MMGQSINYLTGIYILLGREKQSIKWRENEKRRESEYTVKIISSRIRTVSGVKSESMSSIEILDFLIVLVWLRIDY